MVEHMTVNITAPKIVSQDAKRVDQEIVSVSGQVLDRVPSTPYYRATIEMSDGIFCNRVEIVGELITTSCTPDPNVTAKDKHQKHNA